MDKQIQNQDYSASAQAEQPHGVEIDVIEMLYLLWEHIWQIILCIVVGGVLAYTLTKLTVAPTYQATARIYVVSSSDETVQLSDLQVGSSLTADYRDLLVCRPVLQGVIDELSLNMGYKSLEGMINVSNTTGSRILKIVVTSGDPQLSADIANSLVKQVGDILPKIMAVDAANLVESAVVPKGRSGPNYSRSGMLGAIIGGVLCCAVLLIRHLMNDTFVTPDDISKYFGVQPLATIPEGNLGSFNQEKKKKGSKLLRKWRRRFK